VFTDVASIDELPENGTLAVGLPTGERVCLVRCGTAISALRDECPHQGMPLSAGEVRPDGTIECAWHGARFDCCTGAVRQGPAEDDVPTYEVRVDGGRILVGRLKGLND
jgi:3-phenylpropionate/trans-cinnamate dioxygenase ferredoxin component